MTDWLLNLLCLTQLSSFVQCGTWWSHPCNVYAHALNKSYNLRLRRPVLYSLQHVIKNQNAHILLGTICPSLPVRCNNQCDLEEAVCHWLTPVAELGVWPPNIIGQQTGEGVDIQYCSVFFSAEVRENMLQHSCYCPHHSLYVLHLSILNLFISLAIFPHW